MNDHAYLRRGSAVVDGVIVVAIVTLFIVVILPQYRIHQQRSIVADSLASVRPIQAAIVEHTVLHGELPADMHALVPLGITRYEDYTSPIIGAVSYSSTGGITVQYRNESYVAKNIRGRTLIIRGTKNRSNSVDFSIMTGPSGGTMEQKYRPIW